MEKRWEEGCHNATKIWHEIRELGYDGARRTLARWATEKRKLYHFKEIMSHIIMYRILTDLPYQK